MRHLQHTNTHIHIPERLERCHVASWMRTHTSIHAYTHKHKKYTHTHTTWQHSLGVNADLEGWRRADRGLTPKAGLLCYQKRLGCFTRGVFESTSSKCSYFSKACVWVRITQSIWQQNRNHSVHTTPNLHQKWEVLCRIKITFVLCSEGAYALCIVQIGLARTALYSVYDRMNVISLLKVPYTQRIYICNVP